ncbi:MAG: electron transfer flavoprotein subunit beta/FixA family protein [Anaerolineaceae bacterium]|nr:electron transfer flavoprotein subunit beta/FixA family protein [Anaerolineaceae bacterium]
MKIIVPIKQVPETSNVKMDPETGTMLRTGLEAIINPLDLYAIETGLRLREAHGGSVRVISMGPPKAGDALREAVAMGCDDALLLSDRAFAGADTWSTAYVLSRAIREMGGFDLILCGERATDGDTGQVGPGIAAFLDLNCATYVSKAALDDDGALRVERLIEDGRQLLRMPLPSLLTVVKEIASPRLPTLKGMKRAKALQIPVWGPEQINAEAQFLGLKGSPTRVVKIDRPQVRRQTEQITAKSADELAAAAGRFARFIKERGIEIHTGGGNE